MSAALTGHTDIVRLLLEKRADPNAKGSTGRTALMEAAVEGYTDAVRALLEKGADAKAKNRDGETALSLAEKQKHADVIELLKNFASPAQNKDPGKTAAAPSEASGEAPAQSDPPPSIAAFSTPPLGDKARAQAYFRIGMNMQMIEAGWPQLRDLASAWAESIQHELAKVGAPQEVTQLAAVTQALLKQSAQQNNLGAQSIRDLRSRLDAFCALQPDAQLFYSAGDFTYQLALFAQDLAKPQQPPGGLDESRRKILPQAAALHDQ